MSFLFSYSLAVSVSLMLCLIAYKFSLASAGNFSACRLTVIAIYLTSLLLPLCLMFLTKSNPDAIVNLPVHTTDSENQESGIWRYLLIAWSTGCGATLILSLLSLVRIFLIVLKAKKRSINGQPVYVTENTRIAPFSFGKLIVINRTDMENHPEIILSHEQGHIHSHHTLDMLLFQTLIVLCWYNPAAWLFRKELKSVHEFQADRYVLDKGYDMQYYQLFLVKKAARSSFLAIGNNFNKNHLKNRILMMQNPTEYGRVCPLRYFFPALALILAGFLLNIPEVNGALRASAETRFSDRTVNVSPKKGEIQSAPITGAATVKKNLKEKDDKVFIIGGDNGISDNDVIYELDGTAVSEGDLKGIVADRINDISVSQSGKKAIIRITLKK